MINSKQREKELRQFDFQKVEIRKAEEGPTKLVGLIPYGKRSVKLGGFYEIIKPSAFRRTMENGSRVVALRNHNDDQILGSTKSGTLRLIDSEDGLVCEVDLPRAVYAQDLAESVTRGDVNTMSFGFYTIQDDWYQDDKGDWVRDLLEARLLEVSFGVVFPAYEDTTTEARKKLQDYINRDSNEDSTEVTPPQDPKVQEPQEDDSVDSTRQRTLRLRQKFLEEVLR